MNTRVVINDPLEAHTLFISSCRYAYGRSTYIGSLIAQIVRAHISDLMPNTCRMIAKDIREELQINGVLDRDDNGLFYSCDVQPWIDLLPVLDERVNKQNEEQKI